jgi:hypothetical protein
MDCNSHNIPKIRLIARQAGPGSIQLDLNTATFKLLTSSPYNLTIENSLSAFVGAPDSLNNKVVISDSTVNINKSDGSLINSVNVPAEDLDSYNVADSAITVLNSLSNVVDSGNVKATESGNFTAPDGTYENSDSTFTDSVASGELNKLIPDIDLSVNSVVEGSVPSVKDIDIELEDSLSNPITPTSVTMVGDVLTIEVPSGGGSPSGVKFQFPIPVQRTSYRTGDEGWRVQNGWYDYTPPAMPKVVAELDYTSVNWADTLASPLIVNGVSSTDRFVDAFGAKIAGSASVVIDKLQGVAFTRTVINKANWNAAIDDALTYSITVNSITFSDWYLIGLNDILPTTRMEAGVAFAQLIDLSALLLFFSTNVYTATTNPANTSQMWHVVFGGRNYTAIDKTFGISAIYVHDAKNLITAP